MFKIIRYIINLFTSSALEDTQAKTAQQVKEEVDHLLGKNY